MEPKMISQLDFEAQRRRKLAEALSKGNDKPISSPLEGLGRVLREGVAGYQSGKASKFENESKQRQADIIAGVVSGKTPREEGLGQLAQIPAYQETAVKAALEKPKFEGLKESAEQALMAQAMGQPLTPEQQASLQAFDKLRQTEMMYDPRQNIVPKYGSLMQSPAAQGAAPIPAQGTPQPTAGETLPPPPMATGPVMPPTTGGPRDQSLFPPAGLDPKAQGQYMDAMAADAAKRAQNGGMPDLTERQGKATAFAARMEQAEGEYNNLLNSNPNYDPSNAIDTIAGSYIPQQFRNIAVSPQGQQARVAQENWVTGVLRLDSGAVIPADEMRSYVAQYFPVAGDTEATIQQKARARAAALEATKAEAGAGYNVTSGRLENMGLGRGLPTGQAPQPTQGVKRLRFNPATGELE
jgi:hypothetical protein